MDPKLASIIGALVVLVGVVAFLYFLVRWGVRDGIMDADKAKARNAGERDDSPRGPYESRSRR